MGFPALSGGSPHVEKTNHLPVNLLEDQCTVQLQLPELDPTRGMEIICHLKDQEVTHSSESFTTHLWIQRTTRIITITFGILRSSDLLTREHAVCRLTTIDRVICEASAYQYKMNSQHLRMQIEIYRSYHRMRSPEM